MYIVGMLVNYTLVVISKVRFKVTDFIGSKIKRNTLHETRAFEKACEISFSFFKRYVKASNAMQPWINIAWGVESALDF